MAGTISGSVKRGLIGVCHMDCASLVEEETDMLSTENQQWVIDAIDRAIRKTINPLNRTRKILSVLRDWGLTTIIVTIPLALLAAVIALGIRVASDVREKDTDVREEATFRTHTSDRLTAIETSLAALRIARDGSTPTEKKSQIEAIEILATARKEALRLPVAIVEDAGKSFIDASNIEPGAWTAALRLVDYRSYLNSMIIHVPEGAAMAPSTQYLFNVPNGKSMPISMHALKTPSVPMDEAALLEEIGRPSNPDIKTGDALVMLAGGAIIIDNLHMRHVVLKGVEVHYTGKPAILEDVTFLDCTFVIENTLPGRGLGVQVLAANHVDFTSKG